jgi:hypothetical protein
LSKQSQRSKGVWSVEWSGGRQAVETVTERQRHTETDREIERQRERQRDRETDNKKPPVWV